MKPVTLSSSRKRSRVDDRGSGCESSPAPPAKKQPWRFQPVERDHVDGIDAAALCPMCQRIDFEAIFSIPDIEVDGIPVAGLGQRPNIEQAGLTCTLCLFFSAIAREQGPTGDYRIQLNHSWHLRVYSGFALTGKGYTLTQRRKYRSTNILALMPGIPTQRSRRSPAQSLILPAKNSLSAPNDSNYGFLGAEPLRGNSDCWKYARQWMNECVDTHTTCPKLNDPPKVPVKVVDCQSRMIVPYRKWQRYITLSYVWGAGTGLTADEAKQLEESEVLPAKIPRTIEDALKAVMSLGERFLWVDQYCISHSAGNIVIG